MTELEKEIVDIIGHSLKLYVRIPENTVVNYDLQGSVTIRWYGESNGYYSESVDFIRVV